MNINKHLSGNKGQVLTSGELGTFLNSTPHHWESGNGPVVLTIYPKMGAGEGGGGCISFSWVNINKNVL